MQAVTRAVVDTWRGDQVQIARAKAGESTVAD